MQRFHCVSLFFSSDGAFEDGRGVESLSLETLNGAIADARCTVASAHQPGSAASVLSLLREFIFALDLLKN